MCMDNDWESQTLREIRRRARKEHHCAECRKTIRVGAEYVVTSVLTDHHVSEYKHCLKCDRVVSAHFAAERALGHYSGTFTIGELRQQVLECVTEEPAYLGNFRKAWRGEALPRFKPPRDPSRYSSVSG